MAEAAVESRYYCHQCSNEIIPTLPEFTCPDCQNGFIEDISESESSFGSQRAINASTDSPSDPENDPPSQADIDEWSQSFLQTLQSNLHRPGNHVIDAGFPPLTRRRISLRRAGGAFTRHPVLENFMTQLFGGAFVNGAFQENGARDFFFNTHGMDPGDFVWGPGGIDIIVTQLLNQMEGTGAPPADKSIIDSLPTIHVSQTDVDKSLECPVCMDHYKVNEAVRLLPCQHKYHNDCIVPWLQIHGTCPVCRKDMNGELPNKDHATDTSMPDAASLDRDI